MDSDKELVSAVAKMSSEIGDLADSMSRVVHRSEANTEGMNELAELLRVNTAALEGLAQTLNSHVANMQTNTQAMLNLAAVIQVRGSKRWWQ